jgi:two-component system, sensor histidine kinase and response regulator
MGAPSLIEHTGTLHPEILLVEDEQIVALELRERLTRLGYRVTGLAATGEAALHSIEARRPDLVLMDIVLAGHMTGTETAIIVRRQFDIPVVYLTAYSDPATLEQVKDTEGQGYLTKPFQPHELDAVIQLALSRHRKDRSRRETERRAWAETSHKSQEQLEQFTYSAGHDLQEPLRTARAFLDLLGRRANSKLDEEERKLLREAQGGLARMNTLLQDLVAYAQAGFLEGASLPDTPANAILAEALENLHEMIADSNATVLHDDLPTVRADPPQLVQVFQNLLGNAIKYRNAGHEPYIHVSAEKRGDEFVFSVKDDGIGFDPKYAESIFAPFKRLHGRSAYSGTGIGLAICRKIVEGHGGKIWAEAAPGAGATFFFTLPDLS